MPEVACELHIPVVHVMADIGIHQALNAIETFSQKYPADRLAVYQAEMLELAARTIRERILIEKNKAKAIV